MSGSLMDRLIGIQLSCSLLQVEVLLSIRTSLQRCNCLTVCSWNINKLMRNGKFQEIM